MDRIRRLRTTAAEVELGVPVVEKVDPIAQEIQLCSDAMDSAMKSARVIAGYLFQKYVLHMEVWLNARAGTSKAAKTSYDTDYRVILHTFIKDLLTVLYRPDLPAAALFLNVVSRLMVRSGFPNSSYS